MVDDDAGMMDEKGGAVESAKQLIVMAAVQGGKGIAASMLPYLPEGANAAQIEAAIDTAEDGIGLVFQKEMLEQARLLANCNRRTARLRDVVGTDSTPNCDCRNYDSQLRPSHLRRICVAFASQKPEARANTPKKARTRAGWPGGNGGGLGKHEPHKTIRENDNPDGPGIPKEPRA